jgi:hypothetical protein
MSRKNTGIARGTILTFLIATTIVICVSTRVENQNSVPQIAVDAEGNSYLVWVGWRTSCDKNDDIYWMKMSAEGVRSPIQKISTHPDNIENWDDYPQIAVDPQGNSYVIWQGFDGHDSEIYCAKIDAEGVLGEVKKISTHPDNVENDDENARIAVDPQGNSYIVWEGCKRNTFDCGIYWVRIDAEGVSGEVKKISTHPNNENYTDQFPDIAVDSQGTSYVVWEGHEKDDTDDVRNYDIFWVKTDAEGIPGEVQKISAYLGKERNLHHNPRIVVDDEENSYVVWNGSAKDAKDTLWIGGIYWVKIDSESVPGEIQRISAHPDDVRSWEKEPRIVMDGERNSYVVWNCCVREECDISTWDEVHWVKINAEGVSGEVLNVFTHPDSSGQGVGTPEIAIDPRGNSFVVWSCYGGKMIDVCWVCINADSVPGEILKLSTYRGGDKFHNVSPHIAADAKGNLYVAWYTYRIHVDVGIPYDVYWVKIEASGTPEEVQKISAGDLPCASTESSAQDISPW